MFIVKLKMVEVNTTAVGILILAIVWIQKDVWMRLGGRVIVVHAVVPLIDFEWVSLRRLWTGLVEVWRLSIGRLDVERVRRRDKRLVEARTSHRRVSQASRISRVRMVIWNGAAESGRLKAG